MNTLNLTIPALVFLCGFIAALCYTGATLLVNQKTRLALIAGMRRRLSVEEWKQIEEAVFPMAATRSASLKAGALEEIEQHLKSAMAKFIAEPEPSAITPRTAYLRFKEPLHVPANSTLSVNLVEHTLKVDGIVKAVLEKRAKHNLFTAIGVDPAIEGSERAAVRIAVIGNNVAKAVDDTCAHCDSPLTPEDANQGPSIWCRLCRSIPLRLRKGYDPQPVPCTPSGTASYTGPTSPLPPPPPPLGDIRLAKAMHVEPPVMIDGTGHKRAFRPSTDTIAMAHRLYLSPHEWTWTQDEQEAMAVELWRLYAVASAIEKAAIKQSKTKPGYVFIVKAEEVVKLVFGDSRI